MFHSDHLIVPQTLHQINNFDPNNVVLYWNKTSVAGDTHSPTLGLWHDLMLDTLNPAIMDNRLDGYYGKTFLFSTRSSFYYAAYV